MWVRLPQRHIPHFLYYLSIYAFYLPVLENRSKYTFLKNSSQEHLIVSNACWIVWFFPMLVELLDCFQCLYSNVFDLNKWFLAPSLTLLNKISIYLNVLAREKKYVIAAKAILNRLWFETGLILLEQLIKIFYHEILKM